MKIILVCFLHLDEIPPVMTTLKVLAEKYEVAYIGVDDCSKHYEQLFGANVAFYNVVQLKEPQGEGFRFRVERRIYRERCAFRQRNAKKLIEKLYQPGDVLWILHEYTLLRMARLEQPYYLTMYEMPKDIFNENSELIHRINMAKKVVVPEYTRAAIIQACAGLVSLPKVIQNKPCDYGDKQIVLEKNPMCEIAERAHAEGKKVVLYSGIFLRERKLDTIIQAIDKLQDQFVIVLVGRWSEYLNELLATYPNVQYIGFFDPPTHLSIIEKTDIGILTYVSDSHSINPVFCAPNKIWEYAKYGIPMLCNDIPGLKFTVEYNHFGYCCDINSVESICQTLNRICQNYDVLSENSKNYYKSVNIERDILNLIEDA